MTESVHRISIRPPEGLGASRRRIRWAVGIVSCLAAALAVSAPGPRGEGPAAGAIHPAEARTAPGGSGERAFLSVLDDPLYDQFLRQFAPLRNDPERRRYLTAQVLAAAGTYRADPDLLFALVAVESGFQSNAVSSKGARGLGQMQFQTAHAVAPLAVRRPEDLHDVARNLYATARHLRQLLDDRAGDLRAALLVYYGGPRDRIAGRRAREAYVARVSTYYARLKAGRTRRSPAAGPATDPPATTQGAGQRSASETSLDWRM